MTGDADAWRTLVFTTPWGTCPFYEAPQTGDELMPWMIGLALVAALGPLPGCMLAGATMTTRREEEIPEE